MTRSLAERVDDETRRPWGAIVSIGIILLFSLASLPFQIAVYRQLGEASKAKQLQDGQRAICEQINAVATQAGLKPTDCTQINVGR